MYIYVDNYGTIEPLESVVKRFLKQLCTENSSDDIERNRLFKVFKHWFKHKYQTPLGTTQTGFTQALRKLGYVYDNSPVHRKGRIFRVYCRIKLKKDWQDRIFK